MDACTLKRRTWRGLDTSCASCTTLVRKGITAFRCERCEAVRCSRCVSTARRDGITLCCMILGANTTLADIGPLLPVPEDLAVRAMAADA
eukprot:11276585-Prorocentrum_lima.AAC.1